MKSIEFLKKYLNDIEVLDMDDEQFLNYNYLGGHIDSFGIIHFIMAIEEEFNIQLLPEDTESEEFRTISGLIKIIENKI